MPITDVRSIIVKSCVLNIWILVKVYNWFIDNSKLVEVIVLLGQVQISHKFWSLINPINFFKSDYIPAWDWNSKTLANVRKYIAASY